VPPREVPGLKTEARLGDCCWLLRRRTCGLGPDVLSDPVLSGRPQPRFTWTELGRPTSSGRQVVALGGLDAPVLERCHASRGEEEEPRAKRLHALIQSV
jgi:hypothetical protein